MTIQLQSVEVLDNPAPFTSEFKFRITFDCIAPGVKEELEWKLVYVGSADNEDNDQELDSILAPPPDPSRIPHSDLLDVTVVLLTCLYKDQEFIRIGYYVHNEYSQDINDNTLIKPDKIIRNILHDKPRVTRFNIAWDNDNKENSFKPLPRKQIPSTKDENDSNDSNDSNEMKENDQQYDDEQDVDDEEVDLEATDDEQDDEEEEDIDDQDVQQQDNNSNNSNNNNNVNNNNDTNENEEEEEEDDDIDMAE